MERNLTNLMIMFRLQLSYLIILVFSSLDKPLFAQCNPGDFKIGEDQYNYYCAVGANRKQIKAITKNLDELLKEGPNQMIGEEWKYRSSVIRGASCIAKNGKIKYKLDKENEKIIWDNPCDENIQGVTDCSGLTSIATRFAELFVNGFYSSIIKDFAFMNDANGQAQYFKKYGAFIPAWGNPTPGDQIFFEKTYDRNNDGNVDEKDGITHTAIFLGQYKDGTIFFINASSNKGKVVITKMDTKLKDKLVGYGNISKLLLKVK